MTWPGLCLGIAVTAAAFTAAGAPPAAGQAGAIATVRAVDGWQDAAVDVSVGATLAVRYITGTWTINTAGNWFDADGYPGYYPRDVQGACAEAALPDEQNGALIGRIGDGPPFLIGRFRTLVADRPGALRMRMNDADACRADNGGSVEVEVRLDAATPAPATDGPGSATPGTPLPETTVPTTAGPGTPMSVATAARPTASVAASLPRGRAAPATAAVGPPLGHATSVPAASSQPLPPAQLPRTGGGDPLPAMVAIAGLMMVVGAGARSLLRRRLRQAPGNR